MSEILQYNNAAANKLLEMYRTPDVQSQRREFLQFVRSAPGQKILDVGSGPGFLTSALGDAVGPSGSVIGIDISDQMLAFAEANCAEQPWVEFHKGDAAGIPFPDIHFDVVVSMQVLEYISDVRKVLGEIQRVLGPGGQALLMDTDWDSLVWYSPDPDKANQILAEWNTHVTNPYLPRTLSPLLHEAGFRVEKPQTLSIFNPSYTSNSFSNRLIDLIVPFVIQRGNIPADEVRSWARELRSSGKSGKYFFSLNRYIFSAIKL
ncbi:MAG: methyltransferase domain-containing protein [Anaerolineaceae bacterium]|nr:methyltransferase domain-containing protein [Anaerolineaceae bacterium]